MAGTTRVFRATNKSKSAILLSEESVSLIGDNRHFIVADERGLTFKGPSSFVSFSNDMRYGGLFVGQSELLQMIPSTIVSPIPHRLPFPPVFGLVNIARDVSFFAALLA